VETEKEQEIKGKLRKERIQGKGIEKNENPDRKVEKEIMKERRKGERD
jgi:hypothetical protein